ncbi:MAG: FKBP-type peptidyl-prolyl cis-trans isomerase [Cryobacterium sp.]
MRKQKALIATAGVLLLSLTACSSPGATTADCEPVVFAGAASDLITVEGAFGEAPQVDFPTPLKTDTTQRSEIIAGSGEPVVNGQKIQIELSVYNGTTGEAIEESAYDGSTLASFVLNENTMAGLTEGLTCTQVGSRVAVAVSPEDAFGPQGGNEAIGVAETDTLVFVVDVVKSYLTRADGAAQAPQAGFPSVVLTETGIPGITVPAGDAPTDLKVSVLKKGAGDTVEEGDPVTVHYTGVLWDTQEVFDSSWETGQPAEFLAADGAQMPGGVIPGFADALIGQTVGSQIIAVIPPDQGYGDQESGTIPAGSTLVFVVDILGVN